ncbi:MAG: molybdopterin-dependent oxidoreductase [Gammaproteobacteria bacterium]|nr:molybdopterin-dependent oxidoreductase [Gammaproteobacteria bacterium]
MTTRRDFIKGVSGGLLLYFHLPVRHADAQDAFTRPAALAANPALESWLKIRPDGIVEIATGKCELGQGIQTALAQIAAEELDVGFERIRILTVDTAHSPNESFTSGSLSVEMSGAAVRTVTAEARGILTELAAGRLGVDAGLLSVQDGAFLSNGVATRLDYWSLVEDISLTGEVSGRFPTKDPARYDLVGQPAQRLDIPPKIFGDTAYIHDMRLDGMLHARVVRPADRESKLNLPERLDDIAAMPGIVKIVRDGSFLAVVARREDQAVRAAQALAALCTWSDPGLLPDRASIGDWLRKAEADVKVVAERSDPDAGTATRNYQSHYNRPFQAHASISPSLAIAWRRGDSLTVWSHAQGMFPLRGAIAALVGLDENDIRCIHAQGAGCYGHNGADDAAADAALIAMHIEGVPVRLQWSRADEFLGEPFGSAMTTEIQAGLDRNGRIVHWRYDVWSGTHSSRPRGSGAAGNLLAARQIAKPLPVPPVSNIPQPSGGSDRNAVPLYSFPNQTITKHLVKNMPLRVSSLRALGAYANVFSIESFMDEIAQDLHADPIEFRIQHLSDARAIAVLEKLHSQMATAALIQNQPTAGVGIGFAKYKNLGAYCAVAMRLTVDPESSEIRLDRAIAVVDAGMIVNPNGIANQIEGGIIQSASWTLKEQVLFGERGVESRDWASYPILGFSEVPDIDVVLLQPPGAPAAGVGEAAQGPTAAAIANAVARATGKRIRDLPLTRSRLLAG